MREKAKRRLIGAAVIVALLVIFLPMLLEEDISDPVSEQEMTIPPPPDFDQGYAAPVSEPPVEPSVSTFPEYGDPLQETPSLLQELPPPEFFETPATTRSGPISEPALAPVEKTPPPVRPRPTPKAVSTPKPRTPPATRPKPVSKAAAPRPKAPPAARPKSAPKPAPPRPSAPARASAGPSSWVIQVASLREYARADALVQDLRVKGFPAYIQEARVKRKVWYRIRIGPELTRKRIESMAASLRRKTGLKGRIQRYP